MGPQIVFLLGKNKIIKHFNIYIINKYKEQMYICWSGKSSCDEELYMFNSHCVY